ncbi:hypothetical protein [Promicromonospora sp. NFX87]|uniref:hypothetical protein n=1 Tax=Promicromonospora sp. NFX87 TaxID=3402691 RepID=UPI003AFAB334
MPSAPAEAAPGGERAGATPTPAAPGADESEPGYDLAGAPSPVARASWGREERAAAASAAEDLVDAYLDSDTRWWDRLSVLLTPAARAVYNTVPPEALPAASRTGSAEVSPTASALLAVATVPTGAGPYEVTLVRADGASPWLADKIVPVDS